MKRERQKNEELPDIKMLQAELSKWQSLDTFARILNPALDAIPSNTFFKRSGLSFLREGWMEKDLERHYKKLTSDKTALGLGNIFSLGKAA